METPPASGSNQDATGDRGVSSPQTSEPGAVHQQAPAPPPPPAAPPPPVATERLPAARIESFPLLDRETRRRHETDVQLSFAMYLVLGFLTLGIYSIYVHYKLIARQRDHFRRMLRFCDDLLRVIEERAEITGQSEALAAEIAEVRSLKERFDEVHRKRQRSPGLWIVLSILSFGLLFFYVLYFLNDDLVEHQQIEAEYLERASLLLNKLGVGRHPVIVEQVVPDRSFPLYLILTIVTLGLFELYWAYARIKDGNEHFNEHARFEDQLLSLIRAYA